MARRIMVLDDNEANVALLTALLASWGYREIVGLNDPVKGLDLCRRGAVDLLLLDLHMPELDGLTLLRELAPLVSADVSLPVLVLSGQSGPDSKREALEAGARDFLLKPFDADEVRLRVRNALQVRGLQLAQHEAQRKLAERVHRRTEELDAARLDIVARLARTCEFRDDATGDHTRRVGRTTALLAERHGVAPRLVRQLELAAPLHDIGKIAIPDVLLLKPGRLTREEFEQVKDHTTIGAELLAGSTSKLLQMACTIALTHHERWDGTGYPHGLLGESIPLVGRLTAIADVFDALTHDRPYKRAWPVQKAAAEMAAQAGRQFDPQALQSFLELDHHGLI